MNVIQEIKQEASYEHYMRNTVHDAEVFSRVWVWCYLIAIWRAVAWRFDRYVVCWYHGHKWECIDFSAENGTEDIQCQRCGENHHHQF